MPEPYAALPPAGPGAPLRTEREVRYKAYTPKLRLKRNGPA